MKRFRAEEDAWVRLVVDASGSMAFGEPTKLTHAQRIAAALGYLALAQGERVDVCVAPAAHGAFSASDVLRGPGARGRLLRALSQVGPRGRSRLAESALRLLGHAKGKTAVVVLSDFLEEGIVDALALLAGRGHTLVLVHVLAQEELRPDDYGDFLLEDAESGDLLLFTADEASLARYQHELAALQERLRQIALATRGRYVCTPSHEPLPAMLPRLLALG